VVTDYEDGIFEVDVAELSLEIACTIARTIPPGRDTSWAVITALMLAMLDEVDGLPEWDAQPISQMLVDEFAMRTGFGSSPSNRTN
jgi:hypothetical protein